VCKECWIILLCIRGWSGVVLIPSLRKTTTSPINARIPNILENSMDEEVLELYSDANSLSF